MTGFEVDKRNENVPVVPANQATHAQEAWGVLFFGKYIFDWNNKEKSFDEVAMM